MKAIEQCVPVVLFIMLHKVALSLQSLYDIFDSHHVNETFRALQSNGDVFPGEYLKKMTSSSGLAQFLHGSVASYLFDNRVFIL